MLVTGNARRDTFQECIYANSNTDVCRRRRQFDPESVFYLGGYNWTPTARLIGVTTVALVLFIAYLRIWKRPDES